MPVRFAPSQQDHHDPSQQDHHDPSTQDHHNPSTHDHHNPRPTVAPQEHAMSTFDTPRPIEVTIDLALGAVHLRAGHGTTTDVEVRPSDPDNDQDVEAAAQVRVEFRDDRLVVRGPRRAGMLLVRSWISRTWGGSVDVTVDLPTGSMTEMTLGSADVDADGRLGDCRIRTGLGSIRLDETDRLDVKSGAGDLVVQRIGGHADVTTASGQVNLGEVAANAVVRNSNGATRIDSIDGHLRIKAANGDIAVGQVRGDLVAKSANGNVAVDAVTSGTVVLETHVGDVEVGIPEGTAAWLDLDATAGQVDNQLTTATKPDAATDKVEVRARTTLGAIVVRRPAPNPTASKGHAVTDQTRQPGAGATATASRSAITIRDLRRTYGDHLVLDEIDLEVAAGTVFALLGPNGAGKTTMVNILTTLISPDSGTVTVAGHDLATDADAVRQAIGVTGQFSAVDDLFTGAENLRVGTTTELDAAASRLGGAARDGRSLSLQVPGDGSPRALRELLDRLDHHRLTVEALSMHAPDLDDVFLALTGQDPPTDEHRRSHPTTTSREHER